LECLSLCWHAPLRRYHPDYCTAEVGIPGGTYELPWNLALLCRERCRISSVSNPWIRNPVLL